MDPSLPTQIQPYDRPILVPLSLLNWCLYINSVHAFDIRVASAFCLNSYFKDNKDSKLAFLNDQIKSYTDPTYFTSLHKEEEEQQQQQEINGNSVPTPLEIYLQH